MEAEDGHVTRILNFCRVHVFNLMTSKRGSVVTYTYLSHTWHLGRETSRRGKRKSVSKRDMNAFQSRTDEEVLLGDKLLLGIPTISLPHKSVLYSAFFGKCNQCLTRLCDIVCVGCIICVLFEVMVTWWLLLVPEHPKKPRMKELAYPSEGMLWVNSPAVSNQLGIVQSCHPQQRYTFNFGSFISVLPNPQKYKLLKSAGISTTITHMSGENKENNVVQPSYGQKFELPIVMAILSTCPPH